MFVLRLVFTGDQIGVRVVSASDLVKFENRSHKPGVRTVPFSSDSAYDSDAYEPVKTRLSES